MNVNKKLGRFKQWAGERMGGEVRTNTSEEFKMLEQEMQIRHEGMDKMHKSMNAYVKHMNKRSELEDKEKAMPVGAFGSAMVGHSDDFEPDNEFGLCLKVLGRANERISRVQESYVSSATSTWLESAERSLAQMKEYQGARKKLETRRLAYDASLVKMQKAKKEDFRVEEELRSQKAKYEESSEEVLRRMQDIKEAEVDTVQDLTAFLEAELSYYDRCREVLLQVKREWPVQSANGSSGDSRRGPRSRSNTAHDYESRFNGVEEEPPPPKLTIPKLPSRSASTNLETQSPDRHAMRPPYGRSTTFEGSRVQRDISPAPMSRLTRVPTEPTAILANRAQLRPVRRPGIDTDVPTDDDFSYNGSSSPFRDRSTSPATSYGSHRSSSWTTSDAGTPTTKRAPPPPPPAPRSVNADGKKRAPPPPPKRSALNQSEVPR